MEAALAPQPGGASWQGAGLVLRRGLLELGHPRWCELHLSPFAEWRFREAAAELGVTVVCDTRLDVDAWYLLCEPRPKWRA